MSDFYTASQDAQAITTAVDLFHITVAAEKGIRLHWLELMQTTDLGDAAEEVLRIGIYRGVTGGGGGTALTEASLGAIGQTPTASAAVTGQGTASTSGTLLWIVGWNVRQAGPIWVPTPEMRPSVSASTDPVAFRLLAAPTDSITVSATVAWEELN